MFGVDNEEFYSRIALIEGDEEITYKQLSDLSKDIVTDVPERSLILILTGNTTASIAGYVGCINAKVVPLLLNSTIDRSLRDELVMKYRPSFIWTPQSKAEEFEGYGKIYENRGYALLKSESEEHYPLHEDLCVLISTSGSTGSPKLVRQTYKNISSNTASIIEYLEIDKDDRAITSLPMSYVYGLSVVNTHLQAGASLVLTDHECYMKGFWDTFYKNNVTSFAGVPFMYEMLDKLRTFKKDIPGLKVFTQAGGRLNADLQEKLTAYALEHGKKFIVMYGASEATARMAYLPMKDASSKKGSMGIPIPGGRFEILDANDNKVETPETTGELIYYGDNVTYGYAVCGEDLAKGDENHGRLATGDMAKFDEDGFYYIVGRKKRFIKMFGNRINLDDVDNLLKKRFDTLEIVSSGKDDFLDVYVVDGSISEDVCDYIFETMGINKKRMAVYTIEKIPRNASGKILFSELEQLKSQKTGD